MCRAALALVLLAACAPLSAAGPAAPAPPEASFTLAGGWVEFVVERNGRPVADARVTVLVGATVWATGETGPTGRGTFPRPAGRDDCQVVFDFGFGASAPIPLTVSDGGTVTPARAPVLGAVECCQPVRRPAPPASPAPPTVPWGVRLALAGAVAFLGPAVALALWWRVRRAPATTQNSETQS
ncbi:hypothetical protein GobsT_16070 [Gemmata obscuriglobus]|uniref:hypothetical protein n=1 Tax=Gemmata obscuriglobus TaxID=114 RepID=UPI00016C41BB|nr:hypothetical protein [Gemmata obscuriglobus]QEG26859.1 hypothetical protein GobsT_16070 [Gemmata obscuriglobus]VTS02868.1 unnamed protein product [Gemmata obscuriglobus UQM 2246]